MFNHERVGQTYFVLILDVLWSLATGRALRLFLILLLLRQFLSDLGGISNGSELIEHVVLRQLLVAKSYCVQRMAFSDFYRFGNEICVSLPTLDQLK